MKYSAFLFLLALTSTVTAFSPCSISRRVHTSENSPLASNSCYPSTPSVGPHRASSPVQIHSRSNTRLHAHFSMNNRGEPNFLLDEFRTADGEVINPYEVLNVSREAALKEIKYQYRKLSKVYHPDGFRNENMFPGSCKSREEVREEWDRIKFAYEILSNHKLRLKYNRHIALSDPKATLTRFALGSLEWGLKTLKNGAKDALDMAVKIADDYLEERQRNGRKFILAGTEDVPESKPEPASSSTPTDPDRNNPFNLTINKMRRRGGNASLAYFPFYSIPDEGFVMQNSAISKRPTPDLAEQIVRAVDAMLVTLAIIIVNLVDDAVKMFSKELEHISRELEKRERRNALR